MSDQHQCKDCELYKLTRSYFDDTPASEIADNLLFVVNLLNRQPESELTEAVRKELIHELTALTQWVVRLQEVSHS